MMMSIIRQQKHIKAMELRNKILCDEHTVYQTYVMDLEKQKETSSAYRYKLLGMMQELQQYVQPTQIDKVMVIENELRDKARQLLHETLRAFEDTSEGGDLDF